MAGNLNDPPANGSKKNGVKKSQTRGATFTIRTGKNGRYYNHPQKGQIEVVALYCDCGRSVLVSPKELKGETIICSLCDSAFRWQQLTFGLE